MKPHIRVLLFCLAVLLAPALYSLGDRLAGLPGAALLSGGVLLASLVYVLLGQRPRRPSLSMRAFEAAHEQMGQRERS